MSHVISLSNLVGMTQVPLHMIHKYTTQTLGVGSSSPTNSVELQVQLDIDLNFNLPGFRKFVSDRRQLSVDGFPINTLPSCIFEFRRIKLRSLLEGVDPRDRGSARVTAVTRVGGYDTQPKSYLSLCLSRVKRIQRTTRE